MLELTGFKRIQVNCTNKKASLVCFSKISKDYWGNNFIKA